ncbi:MAG: Gfo/Idh/MocA family protein [Rhodopila sp.]
MPSPTASGSRITSIQRRRNYGSLARRGLGLTWVGDYDAILKDSAIDAVVLATPHRTHTDMIVRAVAAGKHVFVEKPIALSVADARRSIDAAQAAGAVLAVGFNRRFHPSMGLLRQEIRAGRFGQLVSIRAPSRRRCMG